MIAPSDVAAIVSGSAAHNERNGITGMLLFSGEHFAQVLEGEHEPLAALMIAIRADRRHCDMRIVLWRACENRRFLSWTLQHVVDLGRCDLLEQIVNTARVSTQRAERLIEYLFQPTGFS